MDNATIHKAKEQKEFFSYLNVFYNAAYTPMYNCIEEIFSIFKYHLRKLNLKSNKDLIENVILAMEEVKGYDFNYYVRNSWNYVRKTLLNEQF